MGWETSERERMTRSDRLTALAAFLAAFFMMPISALAAPDLTDLCHRTADRVPAGHEWGHIRVNANAVERHLAHGDLRPGDPIPGDATFVLDDDCNPAVPDSPLPPSPSDPPVAVPPPGSSELVFAVAYSDVDPSDGGYNPGLDVLIAKLIDGPDTAGDGVPGPGDLIITGQYPEDFDATGFGDFTVTEHVVTELRTPTSYHCWVESTVGSFVWSSGDGDFDQYSEWTSGLPPTDLYDDRSPNTPAEDALSISSLSPSQPTGDATAPSNPDPTDQAFVDVEANCLLSTP